MLEYSHMKQHIYFFQLGREQQIAIAELAAVLPKNARPIEKCDTYLLVSSPDPLMLSELQTRLGGTIRMGKITATPTEELTDDKLIHTLATILQTVPERNFGLSFDGQRLKGRNTSKFGLQIKRILKETGAAKRFVIGKDSELSSVIVRDQLLPPHGTELVVLYGAERIWLGITESVQDWQAWSRRDFNRPARDTRRGMLPPKLARIMINLAELPPTASVLDPFCGVGTVLMEAALAGHRTLIGSDRDAEAIQACHLNWTWLRQHEAIATQPTFFQTPIEKLDTFISLPIGAIVSEADLGPANIARRAPGQRMRALKDLEHQYETWLKILWSIAQENTRLVLAYPTLRQPQIELDLPILAKRIGWSELVYPDAWQPFLKLPLTYARSDQMIGRQFLRLVKSK